MVEMAWKCNRWSVNEWFTFGNAQNWIWMCGKKVITIFVTSGPPKNRVVMLPTHFSARNRAIRPPKYEAFGKVRATSFQMTPEPAHIEVPRNSYVLGNFHYSLWVLPVSTRTHSDGREVKITAYSCYSAPKTVVPTISAARNHVGKISTSAVL